MYLNLFNGGPELSEADLESHRERLFGLQSMWALFLILVSELRVETSYVYVLHLKVRPDACLLNV